jgi:hypothetical protein
MSRTGLVSLNHIHHYSWETEMGGHPVKWIKLARNQCALNSDNVGGLFPMRHSYLITGGSSNDDMIAKVPQGTKHLVFNCHGFPSKPSYPAHLAIGQTLKADNVGCSPLMNNNSCKVIWLSACNIGGDGLDLCKKLAQISGCYVVTQTMGVPDRKMKLDCVEDYYYAMPQYIDPNGTMISRDSFFSRKGSLEFTPL